MESAPQIPAKDGIPGQLRLPTNSGSIGRLPTPLTQSNRSAGRGSSTAKRSRKSARGGVGPNACRECGKPIKGRQRYYCDATCRESYRRARIDPKAMGKAHAKLADLRTSGSNPATTDEAQHLRSTTMKKRREAQLAWEQEHDREVFAPEFFRSEILPGLRNVRTVDLARITGLSVPYCTQIKNGRRVPHPMHWEGVRQLHPI